jgi:uncharacterized membrane protein YgcG
MRLLIKKGVSIICVLSLLLATAPNASAAQIQDHWARIALDKWHGYGVLSGYEDGDLRPDAPVTRAETAKILSDLLFDEDFSSRSIKTFADISPSDWYERYVRNVVTAGYLVGISDSQFAPQNFLTREQAAAVLHRIFNAALDQLSKDSFHDFDRVSSWAARSVSVLAGNSVISGYEDGSFHPLSNVTRAEFITMLDKLVPDIVENDVKSVYSGNILVTGAGIDLSNSSIAGNVLLIRAASQKPPKLSEDFKGRVIKIDGGSSGDSPSGDSPSGDSPSGSDASDADSSSGDSPNDSSSGGGATIGGGGGSSGGGGSGGGGSTNPSTPTTPTTPTTTITYAGEVEVDGTAYALLAVNDSIGGSLTAEVGGVSAAVTDVATDGSLRKVEIPAGVQAGRLVVKLDGAAVLETDLTLAAPAKPAPSVIYGVTPMKFSEFFHDATGGIDEVEPSVTTFDKDGAVVLPKLFITQGNRTGQLPYADGDKLEKVDAVSSATYGDTVHFVPAGNLTVSNPGDERFVKDPKNSVDGIANVEVGVPFDLYANAAALEAAGLGTARTAAVLAKMDAVTVTARRLSDGSFAGADGASVAAADVYKPKYLFADGGWGKRAETAVNPGAVKPLPGTGVEVEAVSYGGNWGDKVAGVAFADLPAEYSGAAYWDAFAEYIYGGYIEDSDGVKEPLVFLQNLFSHRMHEDFDVAISPSRFSRLKGLKTPDTYKVSVFAYGFEDVEFEVFMKDYVNGGAALDKTSFSASENNADVELLVSGVDGLNGYDPSWLSIAKGQTPVGAAAYSAEKTAGGELKITLKTAFFQGAFQGTYTVNIQPATGDVASKPLSFTVVKDIERPLLSLTGGGAGAGAEATEAAPLEARKSDGKAFFTNDEFAAALIVSGRSGYSTIAKVGGTAAAIGSAAARADAGSPYYIDLSAAAFEPGETYVIVAAATGFESRIYYIKVIEETAGAVSGSFTAEGDVSLDDSDGF